MGTYSSNGEIVRATDHEDAARRLLRRGFRKAFGNRRMDIELRSDGVTDEGVRWWVGRVTNPRMPWSEYSGEFPTRLLFD